MSITKKRLLSFVLLSFFTLLVVYLAAPVRVQAQNLIDSQVGMNDIGQTAFGNSTPADIRLVMARIINVALSFLAVVFIVLLILGGFQYMTSEGNEEKTKEAMALIRNAVIGLIVILAAWLLTRYSIIILSKAVNNAVQPGYYPPY